MNPDTHWKVLAPGVIHLPTTGFRILYQPNGYFLVTFNGELSGLCGTLDSAKSHVDHRMREMLEMGMEP